MYSFPVKRLYVVDGVRGTPAAESRARRLVGALGSPPVQEVTRSQLDELEPQWPWWRGGNYSRRTGAADYSAGWTVILDTFGPENGSPIVAGTFRDAAEMAQHLNVCQSALEIHCAFGCYHRCAYCHCDPHFHIACDLETLAAKLPGLFEEHPLQQLWKFDNWTDTVVLEPEYGASELFVPLFADTADRFLMLYTKSDNVDHLLGLRHGGHTIVNWSVSTATQSRRIELNAPDTFARIEAMRRCREAGYTVRARISPIVPIVGWREEMRATLDALLTTGRPDVVTVDVVGWCQPEVMSGFMDVSMLEPQYRRALEGLIASGVKTHGKHLFPHELREPILRFVIEEVHARSPKTPVAICNETRGMWDALGEVIGMEPGRYVCCCGPDSVPGNAMLVAEG
jgi:spore photoproduct lyase